MPSSACGCANCASLAAYTPVSGRRVLPVEQSWDLRSVGAQVPKFLGAQLGDYSVAGGHAICIFWVYAQLWVSSFNAENAETPPDSSGRSCIRFASLDCTALKKKIWAFSSGHEHECVNLVALGLSANEKSNLKLFRPPLKGHLRSLAQLRLIDYYSINKKG